MNITNNKSAAFTKVTIVTPSYNQGNFIEYTILSVIKQDYPNIEHIIIDGGSTDNTLDVIKKYEKKYNMRWLSERDNGQADAINKGFKLSNGEVCGWLNSDDIYFSTGTISYVMQKFVDNTAVQIIFGDDVLIDEFNNFLFKRTFGSFDYNKMLVSNIISQPATFFTKEIYLNNFLDDGLNYAMDFEYWIRLYNKGYQFKYVSKILASNRIHGQRKMIVGKCEADIEFNNIINTLNKNNNPKNKIVTMIFSRIDNYLMRIRGINSLIEISYNNNDIIGMEPKHIFKLIYTQLSMNKYMEIANN